MGLANNLNFEIEIEAQYSCSICNGLELEPLSQFWLGSMAQYS